MLSVALLRARRASRASAAMAMPATQCNAASGQTDGEAPREIVLGVLLEEAVQETWVVAALRQALAVPGVRLAAVAVTRGKRRPSIASRLHRLLAGLDGRIRSRKQRLLAPADVAAELAAPVIEIEIARHADGWDPTGSGAAALRQCRAELWLCFTAAAPRRPIGFVSRHGVWGLEIGSGVAAAGAWAGAMEVGRGAPVTMVSIVDYAQPVDGVLYRSFSATVRNSITRNRLACLSKGLSFFRRLLERLTLEGDDWRFRRAAAPPPPAGYPALREPSFSGLCRVSWQLMASVAANRLRALRWLDQWQIAYYFADASEALRPDRLIYLVPPKDRFWADPMAVQRDGRYFIFFEELFYSTRKGRIVALEVFENGRHGEPQVVLERPYHLSYPFVFEWDGSLFMVPETAENGVIALYRCEAFPLEWRLHKVLVDRVNAWDATLWRNHDRWWMFANMAEPGADSWDELHLYSSATLLGPWTAHRRNPVISDVRRARCAGPLFVRDGMLYRPSQESSSVYGHSVLINRVDVLTEREYSETTVSRIDPGWRKDVQRVHTIGAAGRLRVVDCLVARPR